MSKNSCIFVMKKQLIPMPLNNMQTSELILSDFGIIYHIKLNPGQFKQVRPD